MKLYTSNRKSRHFFCLTAVFIFCNFSKIQAGIGVTYVTYGSLSVSVSNCVPTFFWTTVAENEQSDFIVQRSFNGVNFVQIGTVTAKNTPSSYSYQDPAPWGGSGTIYYRLEAIALSGELQYSVTVSTAFSSGCTPTAPTGLSYNIASGMFTWNASPGTPSSYTLIVSDFNTGTYYTSSFSTSSNSQSYCPIAAGDNVSANVKVYYSSTVQSGLSNTASFTEPSSLTEPTLTPFSYIPNSSGYNLTWNSLGAGVGYNVWVADITNNPTSIPPGTGSAPYQIGVTGVAINPSVGNNFSETELAGHTYLISVQAHGACSVVSPYATTTISPTACDLAGVPTIETTEETSNGVWVLAYGIGATATSYNVKFIATGTTTPIMFSSVAPSPLTTGTGQNFSPLPAGTYQVYIQANCASGSGPWSLAYSGGAITAGRPAFSNLQYDDASGNENSLKLFPVPASSTVNMVYATKQSSGKADIVVFNTLGTSLIRTTIPVITGQNNYSLDVNQLVNGIYTVKLIDGVNVVIQKLIIQK